MRTLWRSALLASALLGLAAPADAGARGKPFPALAALRSDALTRALHDGRLSEAEYALERARSLFQLGRARAEFGDVEHAGRHDATLVLRDLALRLRFLSPAQRAEAKRLLARPDGGGVPIGNGWNAPPANRQEECDVNVCVHWVDRVGDPDRATSTFKDSARATLAFVWSQEVDTIGYRPPLDDSSSANHGPDGKLDVYLEDLGGFGVFGYCTSDDPGASNPTVFAVSAYCVLDNDYSATQYGASQTPTEFLQVTAAHEFNHASQFAYDWLEDGWLMEGTATNIEETVFPDVDDNVAFLRTSQLREPTRPLDRAGFGDTEYGAWIFWRYLEEKAYGDDPSVIRRVWERADASTPFAPDDYSLRAAQNVLAADGKSFPHEYARFGVANRLRGYQDGALYPATPTAASFVLGPLHRSTGWRARSFDHLTARFFSFKPSSSASPTAKLRVDVDLTKYGTRAKLIVLPKSGPVRVHPILLDATGVGRKRVAFGRGQVRRVDLVLSNGSTRTSCFTDLENPPFYSCFGTPRDDDRVFLLRARLR
jgi:hypothetical protein